MWSIYRSNGAARTLLTGPERTHAGPKHAEFSRRAAGPPPTKKHTRSVRQITVQVPESAEIGNKYDRQASGAACVPRVCYHFG